MLNKRLKAHQSHVAESWSDSIAAFVSSRTAAGCVKLTVDWYRDNLTTFAEFARGMVECPEKITSEVVDQFVLHRLDLGNQDSTINAYLRCLRAWFRWLTQTRDIKLPTIKCRRQDQHIIKCYSEEDVCRLVERPSCTKDDFVGLRDHMAILILLGCGIRLANLINLRVGDVDLGSRTLVLRKTKAREEQRVRIPSCMVRELASFVTTRSGQGASDEDYLLCNSFGEQWGRRSAERRVELYCQSAGVDPSVRPSPHTLRHSFASLAVANGVDIYTLMNAMGHKYVTTTQRYLRSLNGVPLRQFVPPLDAMNAHISPRRRLKGGR